MAVTRTIEDAWQESRTAGNNLDAIRLFAAALVIFSHSFEMGEGSRADEPLEIISGQISLGELAVLVFFALSGFLIAKSWIAHPVLVDFARNRALRILPALAACIVVLVFIAGPFLTRRAAADYFSDSSTYCFLLNAVFVPDCLILPGVFDEKNVNAPLWTLAFEAQFYLCVALLGALRLFRLNVSIALALIAMVAGAIWADGSDGGHLLFKLSVLAPPFFIGAAFALSANRIPLDGHLAGISALCLIVTAFAGGLVTAFAFFGVYLALWIAFAPLGLFVRRIAAKGDFSYGLYLWGWPVQHGISELLGGGALQNFAASLPIALVAAWLSWRLVEKPALSLKSRGPAPKRSLNEKAHKLTA